jgi:hypothetical protein
LRYEKADEKKKLELQKKINERVTLLIENKASVSVKTKNALIELQIIPEYLIKGHGEYKRERFNTGTRGSCI